MAGKNVNFIKGNIPGQMIRFALPIILGELLQNLYHSVDAMVVGNFVGKLSLAAVSVCDSPANLMVGFFNGMSLGAMAIVAKVFGGGDKEQLGKLMRIVFSFSLLLGVALSVVGVFCAPLLLRITAVDELIYPQALVYLRIYMIGLMFTIIYNIGSGMLRAIGDSRCPFYILAVVCMLNVILDLLFTAAFNWGVAGVAAATIISQSTSAFLAYRRLCRNSAAFQIGFRELRNEHSIIRSFLSIGLPTGVQSSLVTISNIFVWRYINCFSTDVVAGIGIAQRLDKFVGMPAKSFGMTITAFIGQNEGAGDRARSRKGLRCILLLALITVLFIGVCVYFTAETCVSIFNPEESVVAVGVAMMKRLVPLYFLFYARDVFAGTLRGYGDSTIPTILSLIGMVGVRQIYLALAWAKGPRVEVIYNCYPVAWLAAAGLLFVYMLFHLLPLAHNR